jgi:hypothetical protein
MAEDQAPAAQTPADPAPAAKPAQKAASDKPAAKAAPKEKPPKLEEKPFNEFIEQDYVPSLKQALADQGVGDLAITFAKQNFPPVGQDFWQVQGLWAKGKRQFIVAFPDETINGKKAFAYADGGATPSDVEPFLGDERRMTLDLMVFGVVQRLNGQKWLGRN